MNKPSFFYRYPQLYIWGLRWLHKENFQKRYQYMASFAKPGELVLEPGCGPAILADFLPKNTYYRGFDTNKNFVKFAHQKHHKVHFGNALNLSSFCKADVVVACDILHHLPPKKRKIFIRNCFYSARRTFILCDPGKEDKTTPNGLFYILRKYLTEYIEQDGTNQLKLEYFWSTQQLLQEIKRGFGVIPASTKRKIRQFGEDIIAVFYKNKNHAIN